MSKEYLNIRKKVSDEINLSISVREQIVFKKIKECTVYKHQGDSIFVYNGEVRLIFHVRARVTHFDYKTFHSYFYMTSSLEDLVNEYLLKEFGLYNKTIMYVDTFIKRAVNIAKMDLRNKIIDEIIDEII